MKKRKRNYLLLAVFFILLLCFCGYALFFPVPQHRDGVLQKSIVSPDGTRTLSVYRHGGHATVCWTLSCRIAGKGVIDRNIFWLYHADDAEVAWLDNDTVMIDAIAVDDACVWERFLHGAEGLALDVRTEWYDYRKGVGGIGRDENGKPYLHRWWKD